MQSGAGRWAPAGGNGPFVIERDKPQLRDGHVLTTGMGSHDIKGGSNGSTMASSPQGAASRASYLQDLNSHADVQLFNMAIPAFRSVDLQPQPPRSW